MSDDRYPKIETHLAWCGWAMPLPESWEPLKIEGSWQKGSVMVGPAGTPVVLVKWWRPEQTRFNAQDWLRRRFKALGVVADEAPPEPDGFDATGWVRDLENREGQTRSIWYGYSTEAGLMVECISTSLVEKALHDLVFDTLIPAMTVCARDDSVFWSVFHTRFETPPGYRMTRSRLALGDIVLDLEGEVGSRLMVRQVYPAGLALERRSLQGWVDTPPFLDRRRMRVAQDALPHDEGRVRQRAWKRLPSPLGWLRPRYCDRAVIVDETRDRLCIAEWQDRHEFGTDRVDSALEAMQS